MGVGDVMGKIPHTLLLTVALILDSVSRTFAAYGTLLGSHLQIHVGREIRTEIYVLISNLTSPRCSPHAGYFFIF